MNNEELLQEIELESKNLMEELSLYSEEEKKEEFEEIKRDKPDKKSSMEFAKKKNNLISKGKVIIKNMQKNINDDEYLIKGFGYHSNILYKMCTRFPFLGRTIGVPLMALTKAATSNAISRKIERDKILNLYTKLKGDKAAVEAKAEKLDKLNKPTREQKEELILLKKMNAELEFNLKRLETNYKLSIEEEKQDNVNKLANRNKNYRF